VERSGEDVGATATGIDWRGFLSLLGVRWVVGECEVGCCVWSRDEKTETKHTRLCWWVGKRGSSGHLKEGVSIIGGRVGKRKLTETIRKPAVFHRRLFAGLARPGDKKIG
jgi:hypothetical protein